MGDVPHSGSILFRGEEIAGLRPHEIARTGLGYVPENRDIFPGLTVRENLILGMKSTRRAGRWALEDMFELFPLLRERAGVLGGVLAGGEQQMLTICRTLMGDPDVIMIDEPTEGLAPKLVELVGGLLERIAERGIAILLVEQKLTIALRISFANVRRPRVLRDRGRQGDRCFSEMQKPSSRTPFRSRQAHVENASAIPLPYLMETTSLHADYSTAALASMEHAARFLVQDAQVRPRSAQI